MSKRSRFQQLHFSELSERREKVDGQLMETINPLSMANGDDNKKRGSTKSVSECNLRKSLAWDNAFFTSPGVLDPEELFETLNFRVVDDRLDITDEMEPKVLPSDSSEMVRKSKIGECSMRKSLAWDSAFFTSAGVLDAEELSIVNSGFKKPETHLLPGIEEGIRRSAESNSTENSDKYSLASIEIDLFDNIRVSREASSCCQATSACRLRREKRVQSIGTSNAADTSSQARETSMLSVKPPKVSACANTPPATPDKRTSSRAKHAKPVNKSTNAATGKNVASSKTNCVRNSCNTTLSSTPPVKSPTVLPTGFISKSPPNPLRRALDPQLSCSFSRTSTTPLKCSTRNRSDLMYSVNSTALLSTPKSSCCSSPASSVDGWPSESSSSASPKLKLNISAARRVTTPPPRGIYFDNDASQVSGFKKETRETKFKNPQVKETSAGVSPVPANVSINSRLRMPSPKIGFFDAENSTCPALNGNMKFHSGVQNTSSKIGSSTGELHRLVGNSTRTSDKTGAKDESQVCSSKKQQPLKVNKYVREHGPGKLAPRFDKDNKENMGVLRNQVDDLSRRLETIGFRKSLVAESKSK